MKRILLLIMGLMLWVNPLSAQHLKKDGTPDMRYKENKTSTYSKSTYKPYKTKSYSYSSSYKYSKIPRSSKARYAFMKQTGYPHGRKGYIVDHIIPLSKGGCDCPSNMQWQTKEAAKEKDKWERK